PRRQLRRHLHRPDPHGDDRLGQEDRRALRAMTRRLWKLSLAATLAAACATVPQRPPVADPAALPSARRLAAMDWATAGDEAFADLRGYLMVPTINPPGNERIGAEHLAALLAQDGIESEVLPLEGAPDRASLVARLPGRDPGA